MSVWRTITRGDTVLDLNVGLLYTYYLINQTITGVSSCCKTNLIPE